jgi:hypothetical protein
MAERHQRGMEAAIDRLKQVSEELYCHRDDHRVIIVREIKKVERKKMKIVKRLAGPKGITQQSINDYTHSSSSSNNQDESGQ